MTRIEVSRAVLADPASVALVLAGPAARELWPSPHARPDTGRAIGLVGNMNIPTMEVEVDPPTRAGVGFAASVRVRRGENALASGRLTIQPDDSAGCRLQLTLTCDDDAVQPVQRDAERYLANVATTSRDRSSAA